MQLAINYSKPLAVLVETEQVHIDLFKCPAWPDLVTKALNVRPAYVHFPLRVGAGRGEVMDTETKQPIQWDKIEKLLTQTKTPLVNVHLLQEATSFPQIPRESDDPAHIEMLIEAFLRDLDVVIRRFGRDMVIAENIHHGYGQNMAPSIFPEVICRVVEEAGCGFLLDISHARLAAQHLQVDAKTYINALPVQHIREIHLTGMQYFTGKWVERMEKAGVDTAVYQPYIGKFMDHLPMIEADWAFLDWAIRQIQSGVWREPWVLGFEVGGVGFPWEVIADKQILLEQAPRLYAAVQKTALNFET